MRLIEQIIERGVIARSGASSLLQDAMDDLDNCPTRDQSNVVDAITIIRKELMPRFFEVARTG